MWSSPFKVPGKEIPLRFKVLVVFKDVIICGQFPGFVVEEISGFYCRS
jgi:hypothetical protein